MSLICFNFPWIWIRFSFNEHLKQLYAGVPNVWPAFLHSLRRRAVDAKFKCQPKHHIIESKKRKKQVEHKWNSAFSDTKAFSSIYFYLSQTAPLRMRQLNQDCPDTCHKTEYYTHPRWGTVFVSHKLLQFWSLFDFFPLILAYFPAHIVLIVSIL